MKKEERAACAWRVPKKAENPRLHAGRKVGSMQRVLPLRVRVRGDMAVLALVFRDRTAMAVRRMRERRAVSAVPWVEN